MPSSPSLRRTTLPRLADRLSLGGDVEVSPFCLGIVSDPATVPAAFDAGINFFFITADMHWPLYEATRRGLRDLLARGGGVRDRIVVGVVSYVTQPEFCFMPFQEVLNEIPGLARVDMSIIGGAYGAELPTREAIYASHKKGAVPGVRATGCTFHDRSAAIAAINEARLDLAFVRYNALHPGAEVDLFPHLTSPRRARVYNFKSTFASSTAWDALGLDADHWRPHVTDAYRFVLRQPSLDGILCAMPTPGAVRELDEAMARGPLDDDEAAYYRKLGDLLAGRGKIVRAGSIPSHA